MTAAPNNLVPDLSLLPAPSAPEAAEAGLQRWIDAAVRGNHEGLGDFAQGAADDPTLGALLAAIFGNSPFLGQCLAIEPDFARTLVEQGYDAALAGVFAEIEPVALSRASEETVMTALRRARRRTALAVGIAEISRAWTVEQVTGALSRFADLTIEAAVAHLLRVGHDKGEIALPHSEFPTRDCGLIVLGMGKLGARELNYSSDIDLILLFDHDRVTYTGKTSVQEFFVRLARGLIRILEERTNDGYVFRTDLRLRPDPNSTPPALSTIAAETYYESAGQNWERAAMIKARPVAGDITAGTAFLEILRPFIWRRSLDFDAIQDIQSIKRQINAHRGGAEIAIAGHNVKLGRGGIREIEFFAQTQQLIWGGRDASLRVPATCEALRRLAEAGHIQADAPEQLGEAYRFLRTVEHRLQMIDDQQTHDIPDTPERLDQFAVFMGYADTESFSEALSQRLHLVEDYYAGLFEDEADLAGPGTLVFTGADDHPDTLNTLAGMGFHETAAISSMIRAWHHGRYRATRSARAREILTELMPRLL
ncbi:MAG: glutamine-synthetase adenylyltransferase, partial [Alphaproteobacteria bacterium]